MGVPVTTSVSTMVTTGASPAVKYWPFAGADTVSATSNSGTLRGSLVVQSWASVTARAVPPAGWQALQLSSSSCCPPPWLVATSAKSTVSWHDPHAARDGVAFQLSTFAPVPWWHFWQFAMIAGNSAFHHSCFVFR